MDYQIASILQNKPRQNLNEEAINQFIARLAEFREDWQVQQAEDAIRLYLYFLNKSKKTATIRKPETNKAWVQTIDSMVNSMRLKHLSFQTEQSQENQGRKSGTFLRFPVWQFGT